MVARRGSSGVEGVSVSQGSMGSQVSVVEGVCQLTSVGESVMW